MLPPFIVIGLILNVFPCSAQKPLDPWNKVIPVKEIRMHICINYTHYIGVCNETIGRETVCDDGTRVFSPGQNKYGL